MHIEFLLDTFCARESCDAVVWKDQVYSYEWLVQSFSRIKGLLADESVRSGEVVAIESDFSPNSVAALLALIDCGCIVVPLAGTSGQHKREFLKLSQAEALVELDSSDRIKIGRRSATASHDLYDSLNAKGHPGLVLFSSGSTGKPKAAVHDFARLLEKYKTPRRDLRTLTFLLFDHIGGIDTLFYALSNGSCLITVRDRSPDSVCRAVDLHKVEVLPVSPTFLNLLILSGAHERFDMSSLKYVTYGTEVMPESTLRKCSELFPGVTILQKYGTTEVGTLHSRSLNNDSVWVKLGGDGYKTRVVDGILHIKSRSSMLGYLNAPSPFTDDGWFITGDRVELDGEFIRILGRDSDIINVGGEKVYPAEVEEVIHEVDGVTEVSVFGEQNAIMGNIVCARVRPSSEIDKRQLSLTIRKHCREKLANHKVPVKIAFDDEKQHSERFKKMRAR